MFGTAEEPTALASEVNIPYQPVPHASVALANPLQIMGKKTKTFDITANGSAQTSKLSRIKLTDDEKKRLQERIHKATSLQEIVALEKELNEGRLPSGISADAMEE